MNKHILAILCAGLLVLGGVGLGMASGRAPRAAAIEPPRGVNRTEPPSDSATPILSPTATPTGTATPTSSPTATGTALPPLPGSPTPAWWSVSIPDVGSLGGISGVRPDDLWAVGSLGSVHWDGNMWQPVPVPSPTVGSASLWKVSAGATDSVWAGGGSPIYGPAVVAHWNGQQWTRIYSSYLAKSPAIPTGAELNDVSAYTGDDAYALITDHGYQVSDIALLHCTASACTWVAGQGGPSDVRNGYGVAAFSADDAWIVGVQTNMDPATPQVPGSLILHWDGQQLTAPAHPDIGDLDGVAGSGPDDVWAVGPGGILHWNGQAWSQVPSPAGAAAVSACAPDDAWAVGGAGFLHWDGQTWQQVPGAQGGLADVLALAADDAWAVGSFDQSHALALHYTSLPAFADVGLDAPFYPYIAWMRDHGYASGYYCGGPGEPCDAYERTYYRPGTAVTRAQLLKLVVGAAAWPQTTPQAPTFADVPTSNPFYAVIETGVAHGIISGYTCGGPGEPCDGQQRPYFRPNAAITRGQLAKVISLARGYPLPAPATPTFGDVPPGSPSYGYVEAVAGQGVVSGYGCGAPGEPCPGLYFRPAHTATRGQVAKFITLAFRAAEP